MLRVEEYAKIRLAHRDGMSVRKIARQFRHSRRKIREVLKNPAPQPYVRTKTHPPKLTTLFREQIVEILKEDESAPRKQRHTAVAIFRRLRENGYQGGYDQVRRFVKTKRVTERETFIPLSHDPGQRAEADFGKIYVDFPDGRRHVSVLLITWAYSNCVFAIATPNEKLEAILYGTVKAFEFFDCVPQELWWDNPKTVATEILKGRNRVVNKKYMTLASHYNFEPLFCMPARGNEKPHVENRVKYLQRNWATPVPRVADLDELNRHLYQCCVNDRQRTITGKKESIEARFTQDRKHALPLSSFSFDPAILHERDVDKYQTVAFDRCRYSVPRRFAFQKATVKAYVDRLEIVSGDRVIARHERSHEPGSHILDPIHFLETLERKPACLDHAPVYRNWKLPTEFGELRDQLEQRHGSGPGARQYIRVLQLFADHPVTRVRRAMEQCRAEGVITADRVIFRCERLAQQAKPKRTTDPTVDQQIPAHSVPVVQVPLPNLAKFDSFLSHGGDNHDPTRPSFIVKSEPEATPFTNDVGRICQAGP